MVKKRYPRKRFTKALERICANLDASCIREVIHKDILGRAHKSQVRVDALWVVGSYVRGAVECGDLDLILECTSVEGVMPRIDSITRTFFGVTPLVAFYDGNPEKNRSGVSFPDAQMVWSSSNFDWRSAIENIVENPNAGHFQRPSDRLPITPEQMRGDFDDIDNLLRDYDEKRVQWHYFDFEEYHREQPSIPERFIDFFNRHAGLGKATRHALAHLLCVIENFDWAKGELSMNLGARTVFRIGGTEIHVGVPQVPHRPLFNLFTNRLILLPHFTARGPNRAWIIERGTNHPLLQEARIRIAYAVGYDGIPMEIYTQDSNLRFDSVPMLELYTSYGEAQLAAAEYRRLDEEDGTADNPDQLAEVINLSGDTLLESISLVERVEFISGRAAETKVFTFTDFIRYGADEVALFKELMSLLPGLTGEDNVLTQGFVEEP